MSRFVSSATSSNNGNNLFIWVVDTSVSGKTVTATFKVYSRGNYEPYYDYRVTVTARVGDQYLLNNANGFYPGGSGHWATVSENIGGTNYRRCYTLGSKSYTAGAAGGSVTSYFSYQIGDYSATYVPKAGTYIAQGSDTVAADTYTIKYAANGGTSTPSDQTKTAGVDLTLADKINHNNTTADGVTITFNANEGSVSPTTKKATNTTTYTFSKWQATDGTQYNAKGTYSKNEGTTMTAQWTTSTSASITTPSATRANGTSTRKVTFDAATNGGTCSTASLNSTATITYSSNGWYTATSGGTKRCNNGGSYSPSTAETVYAQWGSSTGTFSQITLPAATKANGTSTRTVTFDANGGSCSTASLNSTATITYSQTGWWTSASGGTNRGNASAQYTPSAAETLYAQFSSSTGTYSAITLPTATRTGYTFKGWNTDKTATTGSTGTYTPSGTYIMYAIWELNAPSNVTLVEDRTRTKIIGDVSCTGVEITSYKLYYRLANTGSYSYINLGTSTRGTIVNLQPHTTYQVYASATNAAGSTDSSVHTIQTAAYIPSVNTPESVNLQGTKATFSLSGQADTNTTLSQYCLYWAPKSGITKNLYDMPLKVLSDNSLWARIFYHNVTEGSTLFSTLSEARDTQTANKYSRLYLLDDNAYKGTDNKFEFMLCYPNLDNSKYNRWKQTDSPINLYTGTGQGTFVPGYEAIHIDWTGNGWGGMERTSPSASAFTNSYLNGSVGYGNWWYAIASDHVFELGMPGPNNLSIWGSVELWVRVGTVPTYSSQTVQASSPTATITGLVEGRDYLAWAEAIDEDSNKNLSSSLTFYSGQAAIWYKENQLPPEYQAVEYIESTGTQYIDTGFQPNQDTRVMLDFSCNIQSTHWIFGARHSYASNNYAFLSVSAFRSDYNTTSSSTYNYANYERFIVDKNKNITTLYKGNENVWNYITPYANFAPNLNMYLFSANENGNVLSKSLMTLYSCKIYDNDILIRNFIPCYRKSDSVVGLYDIVNDVFYTNSGTGTFSKGANVVGYWIKGKVWIKASIPQKYQEVEYIESDGNQIIDLGILGKDNITSIYDIQFNTSPHRQLMGWGGDGNEYWGVNASGSYELGGIRSVEDNDPTQRTTATWNYEYSPHNDQLHCINDNFDIAIDASNSTFPQDISIKHLCLFNIGTWPPFQSQYGCSCKLYGLDIIQGGFNPLMHLVPCYKKSNNEIGLYDTLNDIFYTNGFSGTPFTKGPDINNNTHWVKTQRVYFKTSNIWVKGE